MKTSHFNFLFSEIREELIPSSAELSADIILPDNDKIKGYNRRLSKIISDKLAEPENIIDDSLNISHEDAKENRSLDSMKASVSDSNSKNSSVSAGKKSRPSKPISRSK